MTRRRFEMGAVTVAVLFFGAYAFCLIEGGKRTSGWGSAATVFYGMALMIVGFLIGTARPKP